MDQHTPPTLAEVQGTLDELAAAACAAQERPTATGAALRVAERQGITEEQVSDAYRWGRRHDGAATFDHEGNDMLW